MSWRRKIGSAGSACSWGCLKEIRKQRLEWKVETRLEYTAIGNVVNLASRLCSSAEDGQILIDPAVADAVGGTLSLLALGTRPLRGYHEQIPVFSVAIAGTKPKLALVATTSI